MFFKKAVDDATSEWAQHHAKRFIDTKAKVCGGAGCCVVVVVVAVVMVVLLRIHLVGWDTSGQEGC